MHLNAITFEPPIKNKSWDRVQVSDALLNMTEVPLKERNLFASSDSKKADVRPFGKHPDKTALLLY